MRFFYPVRVCFLISFIFFPLSTAVAAEICQNPDRVRPNLSEHPGTPAEAAQLHFEVAQPLLESELAKGLSHLTESFCIAAKAEEMLLAGKASYDLAIRAFMTGEPGKALNWVEESISAFERSDDPGLLAKSLNLSGIIRADGGDIDGGLEDFKSARDFAESAEARSLIATVDANIGSLYLKSGLYDAAEKHYSDSLDYYRSAEDFSGIVVTLSNLGENAAQAGDLDRADTYYNDSVVKLGDSASDTSGDMTDFEYKYLRADILLGRGAFRGSMNRHTEALSDFEEARDLAVELDAKIFLFKLDTDIGVTLMALNRLDEAEASGRAALALAEELNDEEGVVKAATLLADLFDRKGDFAASAAMLRQAKEFQDRMQEENVAGAVAMTRADVENRYEEQDALRTQSFENARRATFKRTLAISILGLIIIAALASGVILMRRRLSEFF